MLDKKCTKVKKKTDVIEMFRAEKPDYLTNNIWCKLFLFTKDS